MNLKEYALDVLDSFLSVGGTWDMYNAATFMTQSQAYYCGQVIAFQEVLCRMDQPYTLTMRDMDFHKNFLEQEKAYREYI